MSPRKRHDPAKVYSQTIERSERRQGFLNFIQSNGLPKNEESAHLYAFSLGLNTHDRVNLTHELTEGYD